MGEGKEPDFELEQESAPAVSDEEIDFLKDQVTKMMEGHPYSIAEKAIAEANMFFQVPELGMQEEKSAKFLSRRLSHILGEENVGEVGGGVYGILEGTDENGPTIFIRGDMDALPLTDDEAAHMCGHNIHMAWLLENARLLSAYKDHFSELPFNKIVFIGEPNEEGTASPPEFGPQKMIEAGLLEKTGKPDLVLGAHFVAPQPEGTVRIDQTTACCSDGRFNYKLVPQDESQDVAMAGYELIYQIGQEFKSEDPNTDLGKLKIVDKCQAAIPETIVRATDSKPISEERRMRPNILNRKEEVELQLNDAQNAENVIELAKEIEEKWGVEITTNSSDEFLKISIDSHGGHISQGGPNIKYIMAELLHNLKEQIDFKIKNGNQSIEIAGSIRTKATDWQGEGNRIGEKLQEIASGIVTGGGAKIEISGDQPQIDNPPVYNDDEMRKSALGVLEKAQIPITEMGLPMMPAETFAFWKELTGAESLYVSIGGGDKNELEDIKNRKLPVPGKYLHHTPEILDLIHANQAIPYGAVLSLIVLELGKKFNK